MVRPATGRASRGTTWTDPSLLAPAVLGVLALIVLVVAAGRAPVPVGVDLPNGFAGLLRPRVGGGTTVAVMVLAALGVLVMSWWALVSAAGRGRLTLRGGYAVAAAWLTPVLLAPPLLSLDAYAYLAQGRMIASGVDPYAGGPVLLGDHPDAGRVDPMWRASAVPYGPLSLVLLRSVAVLTHDLTTGVLLLRLLALGGVAIAVAVALLLSPAARRPTVLALTVLNPITVVHLLGGAHLDAVLSGLAALALLAAVRHRRWTSWVLAGAAVAVKVSVAPLLLFLLVDARRDGVRRRRLLAVGAVLVAVPWVVTLWLVPRPWEFLPALLVPGSAASWYSPSTWVGAASAGLAGVIGLDVEVGRALGRLLLLVCGATYVLQTARSHLRTHDPDRWVQQTCVGLLVAVLSLPAIYGWYLAAGLFGLAAVARGRWLAALVLLSSALTFSSLPPLYDVARWPLVLAWTVLLPVMGRLGWLLLRRTYPTGAAAPASVGGRRAALGLGGGGTVVLLGATAVGLLAAQATADPRPAAPDPVPGRVHVVQQMRAQYPDLQVGQVLEGRPPVAYEVQLVRPGEGTCYLELARTFGPLAPLVRLPEPTAGRTPWALEVSSCPPPLPRLLQDRRGPG